MKGSNIALLVLAGWVWGYLGSREINRCGSCSTHRWYVVVVLAFFTWPIHWWERRKIQRAAAEKA